MLIMPLVIMSMALGDDRAFMASLYEQYEGLMFKVAWQYTKEPTEAEDIVSDACLALMKNIATIRGLKSNQLKSYLVYTVRSRTINYLTHKKTMREHFSHMRDEAMSSVASSTDIEQQIVLNAELTSLLRLVDALPDKERMVIRLKYWNDMDFREIAKVVGISEESVHKYISRAKSKLKILFYKEGNEK